jgi:hypothetical protein
MMIIWHATNLEAKISIPKKSVTTGLLYHDFACKKRR